MNRNEIELWAGAAAIGLAIVLLFTPLVVAVEYTVVLFATSVLGLALGATLVGLSRRGRAV